MSTLAENKFEFLYIIIVSTLVIVHFFVHAYGSLNFMETHVEERSKLGNLPKNIQAFYPHIKEEQVQQAPKPGICHICTICKNCVSEMQKQCLQEEFS